MGAEKVPREEEKILKKKRKKNMVKGQAEAHQETAKCKAECRMSVWNPKRNEMTENDKWTFHSFFKRKNEIIEEKYPVPKSLLPLCPY